MPAKVIPILRIFDYEKTHEFYIKWLGFTVDWEHRFGENFPVYLQVSREDLVLHLTEHHGDCCPGAKVYIEYDNVSSYHKELTEKNYRYNKPGLEHTSWNSLCFEVTDPFGNRLAFNQRLDNKNDQDQ